ncbi:Hsp20/alpha crystallin family protein [Mobilitalea sibirica]|uniref:Hsp20/alpha crystallin family protein n=1 Tax=Mobilitalea sibirica TaxID=1462919 RepID=A0A8J7KWK4_9FIRM|nr:Hsp20/alpha crystallin family protein [Mobilitalea sibirica]MBH1940572.1 Hsp20/alpha crystallin family protein [Mobilitalea sibirica]
MLRPTIFEPSGPLFFDRVFHDFFGNGLNHFDNFNTDVIDKGDSYQLQAELPGFKKDEINIDIDHDNLTISATHSEEKKVNKNNYVRQERRYNSYCRSFHIPGIKKDEISASYNDGVLEIHLPKENAQVVETKRIEIK